MSRDQTPLYSIYDTTSFGALVGKLKIFSLPIFFLGGGNFVRLTLKVGESDVSQI